MSCNDSKIEILKNSTLRNYFQIFKNKVVEKFCIKNKINFDLSRINCKKISLQNFFKCYTTKYVKVSQDS